MDSAAVPEDPFIRGTFLKHYLADRAAGGVRSAEAYRRLFPGYDAVIDDELAKLENDSVGGQAESESLDRESRVGHYRLERKLGRGGQGTVWLAQDLRLNRKVALKLLPGIGSGCEEMLARFRREAQVTSRLDHPNICTVHDAGIADGVPFIAMRYVEGESLAQKIGQAREAHGAHAPIEVDQPEPAPAAESAAASLEHPSSRRVRSAVQSLVRFFEQAARALHEAHESGIVHRDIKPGNIMVTPRGDPVILDFGLAWDAAADSPELTRSGDVFGTPAYMAPEQLRGDRKAIDRRTDVWALGVSLFECLTLERPFEGATREAMHEAIRFRDPSDLRRTLPGLPRDLKIVVETALEKESDRRYQNALLLAEDLGRVLAMEPIVAKPVSGLGRAVRWARRRPAAAGLLLTLAILVPLLGGVGGYLLANLGEIANQKQLAAREAREARMEKAHLARINWDLASATTMYSELLREDPDSAEVRGGLALTYVRAGKGEEALALLGERPALEERWVALGHIRAFALETLDRHEEAEALRRGLRSPASADDCALVGLAIAEIVDVRGRSDLAGTALRHALDAVARRREAPRLLYHLGVVVIANWAGELDVARRYADAMVEVWPGSPNAWLSKGLTRRGAEAISAFRECLRLDAGFVLAHLHLAQRESDPKAAESHALQAVASGPDNPLAHQAWGSSLLNRGDTDGAVAAFRKAVDLAPGSAWAHLALVVGLRRQGDSTGALASIADALKINPSFGHAHTHRALIFEDLHKPAEALEEFKEGARCSPKVVWVLVQLGLALEQRGDLEGALAVYAKAMQECEPSAWILLQAADNHLCRYRRTEALDLAEKALKVDPHSIAALSVLCDVHCRFGEVDEAVAYAQRAIAERGSELDYLDLALCSERFGHPEEARPALLRALAKNGGSAIVHANLAFVALEQSDLRAAEKSARDALRTDPTNWWALAVLGRVLYLGGSFQESCSNLEAAVAALRAPRLHLPWLWLGESYVAAGRREEAYTLLESATRRWPQDPLSWNDFARFLTTAYPDDPVRTRFALEAARAAVERSGGRGPMMLMTLAAALERNGKTRDAIATLRDTIDVMQDRDGEWVRLRDVKEHLSALESSQH